MLFGCQACECDFEFAVSLRPHGNSAKGPPTLRVQLCYQMLLARALRKLPIPVIGRIEGGRVLLDLRCLEDEAAFLGQLPALAAGKP